MSIQPVPAPTAALCVTVTGGETSRPVGVDLVCDPVDGIGRVLVVIPGLPLSFRLEFTPEQLGALMDELVDLADVAEQQRAAAGVGDLQSELSFGVTS